MDRIICVVGPTASGKTKLAVQLAKLYGGEVVSCDSMQIYKHMDIGTAKPTKRRWRACTTICWTWSNRVRIFRRKYVQLADSCVQDILSRGKTAVIAGGTGLYVDSLIAGRSFAPVPQTGRREALETQLRETGGEAMLARLRSIDPEAAARLHPADEKRIVRALEVYEETGKTITQHNLETQAIPPRYRPVWLGLDYSDRAVLYRRIDLRVDKMLEDGLLDEIRALLALGVSPKATAMQAIGYKEFFGYLNGACTLDEAAALCKQRSRNYAKRQLTWFRRNPDIHWLRLTGTEDFSEVLSAARQNIPFSAF